VAPLGPTNAAGHWDLNWMMSGLNCRSRSEMDVVNHDRAMLTALVIFHVARHCDRIPGLVGYLAAITIRGIAIDSAVRRPRADSLRPFP
jgi:hypothetical protein